MTMQPRRRADGKQNTKRALSFCLSSFTIKGYITRGNTRNTYDVTYSVGGYFYPTCKYQEQ